MSNLHLGVGMSSVTSPDIASEIGVAREVLYRTLAVLETPRTQVGFPADALAMLTCIKAVKRAICQGVVRLLQFSEGLWTTP